MGKIQKNKGVILGIIPARIGSKRIRQKNIRMLLGKPLIAYTISSALKSNFLDDVIVSTDSIKIAKIAKKYGADNIYIRPKKLAQDNTPTEPVVKHVINRYEKLQHTKVGIVVLLQPTSPLRTTKDINEGIKKLLKTGADSLISICKIKNLNNPSLLIRLKDDRIYHYPKSRKSLLLVKSPGLYQLNGALYIVKRDAIMKQGNFFGKNTRAYMLNSIKSIDIDTESDLKRAEAALKNLGAKK